MGPWLFLWQHRGPLAAGLPPITRGRLARQERNQRNQWGSDGVLVNVTRTYAQSRLVLAGACVAIAALSASCATGPHVASRHDPRSSSSGSLARPGQFIAVRLAPKGQQRPGPGGFLEVAVSSVKTGAIVRRLLPADRDGMSVDGLSLDRSGNLWITYSKGPVYQNDLAGGDPKPRSCANEIAILHAAIGRLSVFLRTGNNVLISAATVSPRGGLLAFTESGCATGYLNNYLRITDLRTRHSWTIGRSLARCRFITSPAWSLDGRSLLVAYAPHVGRAYTGPLGTCGAMGPERLVQLTTAAQPGLAGNSFAGGRSCQITSAAPAAGGRIAVVQACGGSDYISGAARLLILSAHLRLLRQFTLGRCTDGNELSADRNGRGILVSAYLYCNPPGRPGPVTRLWSYTRGRLRLITSVPGGMLAVSMMTW